MRRCQRFHHRPRLRISELDMLREEFLFLDAQIRRLKNKQKDVMMLHINLFFKQAIIKAKSEMSDSPY